MERIILVNCIVLCATVLSFRTVLSSLPHNDGLELGVGKNHEKVDPNNRDSLLWISSRLSRKKRSNFGDDYYKNLDQDREQASSLMDVMRESPWAILAVNEDKRHTVNYTPRLGRESAEDYYNNPKGERWLKEQEPEIAVDLLQRSPPFAPRLGRRVSLSPYQPRLGRENDKNSLSY